MQVTRGEARDGASKPLARGVAPWRDVPLLAWLTAAALVALGHRWLPDAGWLMLHLVLLGAVSHAIMVWSLFFAQAVLHAPARQGEIRTQSTRLGLLAGGSALVVIGVPTAMWPVTVAGAVLVGTAVTWHGVVLWGMLRRALPARFKVTVHYYLAAVGYLLLGTTLGATLAWGWEDPWHGRLLVAHTMANVLGWVGLTVTGTLLTLWPTMLGTRMDQHAVGWTRSALPLFCGAVVVAVLGALSGLQWLAALGLIGYLAGLGLWGRSLWGPARSHPPRTFAPLSVAASLAWFVIGIAWAGWLLVTAADWASIRDAFVWPAIALAAGCGVQILIGSLAHLLPAVVGGGPAAARAGRAWFNRAAGFRLIALNGGLALWLLPSPSWVKVIGSLLALAAAVAFLPLMVGGLRAAVRVRRDAEAGPAAPVPPVPEPAVLSAGQVIAGVAALAAVVVVGVGLDPAAAGVGAGASLGAAPASSTGRIVRVQVQAIGMRFVPAQVHISRGDQLVVELVNADTTTHDLVIGDRRTPRIAPGATAELDAGVITESITGFCSVVGHRQMGMVFDVIVDEVPVAAEASPPAEQPGHTGHGGHGDGVVPPLAAVVDPVLPPLTDETVHKLTLTVQEVTLEVAPGVWQRRWTFNGAAPGPVLHGRIGDVFEITLVNDGTIGHSIDFHAGSLAPDKPMRTIEPGETLTYRFTATMAGIWMYHCSTMPMSAHIAAGMFGAVVIEPDDLPAVDRSYLLVQSEVYLGDVASDPASATEVDADAVAAEDADYVAFNGVANAYDQQPLQAKAGERVRFWVLDAGPNRPSSFHVVGARFDTVYSEGGYLLKNGRDGFGSAGGGSQVLGLLPAQGGFVETEFPEAGHYPVVSHVMTDAERGVHGVVEVTD